MEKIVEIIVDELIKPYIIDFFLRVGCSKELSIFLACIIVAVIIWLIVFLLTQLGQNLSIRYKTYRLATNLKAYYDKNTIKRSINYFIPTKVQDINPEKETINEGGNKKNLIKKKWWNRKKMEEEKKELIPFLIKNVFKKENNKYHLFLAGSGMGKTTFLLNLYMKYNSFFNFSREYKIEILPCTDENIRGRIKEIVSKDEAKNTILLLDAFDEYKYVLPKDYELTDDQKRFNDKFSDICKKTQDFRKVIITSRTQYSPNLKDLNIASSDSKGYSSLSIRYLSLFDNEDVKKYLNKKFGGVLKFWNKKKKNAAKKIVDNSNLLMIRPMLLSYIDLLVIEDKNYKNTFDIYETLIKQWIKREAKKRKYKNDSKNETEIQRRDNFSKNLRKSSEDMALALYKKDDYSKGITLKETKDICIEFEGYESTGRSLLTLDNALTPDANWKFAHKSIYESPPKSHFFQIHLKHTPSLFFRTTGEIFSTMHRKNITSMLFIKKHDEFSEFFAF